LHNIQGKYNTSDWLTRQNNLYNLIDDPNPNHNPQRTEPGEYISQVLNMLVNSSVPEEPLRGVPSVPVGGLASGMTPSGVTEKTPPGGVSEVFSNVSTILSVDDMFATVHGGINFHRGALATWKDLNKQFPGHKIPLRVIQDKVAECTTCQTARIGMEYTLPDEKLHLKPTHY
jgi:hypothetical protein